MQSRVSRQAAQKIGGWRAERLGWTARVASDVIAHTKNCVIQAQSPLCFNFLPVIPLLRPGRASGSPSRTLIWRRTDRSRGVMGTPRGCRSPHHEAQAVHLRRPLCGLSQLDDRQVAAPSHVGDTQLEALTLSASNGSRRGGGRSSKLTWTPGDPRHELGECSYL